MKTNIDFSCITNEVEKYEKKLALIKKWEASYIEKFNSIKDDLLSLIDGEEVKFTAGYPDFNLEEINKVSSRLYIKVKGVKKPKNENLFAKKMQEKLSSLKDKGLKISLYYKFMDGEQSSRITWINDTCYEFHIIIL